ncbi:hypothetical protein SGRIM128S_06404 [Streptomyces griseomycini]
MSEHDDRKEPRTAVEEVLREVEEAGAAPGRPRPAPPRPR